MNPLDKNISQLRHKPRKGMEMYISKSLFDKYRYLFINGTYKGFKIKTFY